MNCEYYDNINYNLFAIIFDNNIDGFVDKEDKKVGPYGAFIPQARNMPKYFRKWLL